MRSKAFHIRLGAAAFPAACLLLTVVVFTGGLAARARGEKKSDSRGIAIGDAIPARAATVDMLGVDGARHSIAGVKGEQGTLVVFSCNACPWVKAWEERIVALANDAPTRGVGVIMINANDPKRVAEDSYDIMQKRAERRGMSFPYVVDDTSDIARIFGATRTPEFFLFDAGGELVYHGAFDDNAQAPDKVEEHYLRNALEAMLAGEKIHMPETKAMGCSIKFRPQA